MSTTNKKRGDPEIPIPPLQINSPKEIASYTQLDLALRMHPDLASGEGATLINARALSRLVEGMRAFQKLNSGLESKNAKKWPYVRIPDYIFRTRSATSPLFHLLLSTYRHKQESSNPNKPFDFTSPKRYEENITLLTKVEKELVEQGILKRPVIYMDESIPKKKITEYTKVIKKFGGRVVGKKDALLALLKEKEKKDVKASKATTSTTAKGENNETSSTKNDNLPTHIVAWDEEEHDAPDIITDEELIQKREKEMEKLYLRTLVIVDPKEDKGSTSGGGIVESQVPDSKKKGGKVKGKNAPPPIVDPMALVHWWYWPSSYDDWMLATDVAGEGEIGLPPSPDNGPWVVGCKFVRDVEKFNEWGLEADYSIAEHERKVSLYKNFAKEQARTAAKAAKEAAKKKKEAESKKENISLRIQLPIPAPAVVKDRREGNGMNPRQIVSGVYMEGNRSVKLRRTVYDGALRVPENAVNLLKGALNHIDPSFGDKINLAKANYTLPPVGSVMRPSEDPALFSKLIVTELTAGNDGSTIVKNKMIKRPRVETNSVISIRGGGEGVDVEMTPVEGGAATTSTTAPASAAQAKQQPTEGTDTTQNKQGEVGTTVTPATANIPTPTPDATASSKPSTENPQSKVETPTPLKPIVKLTAKAKADSNSKSKEPLSGDQEPTIKLPEFYNSETVSDFEKRMLPEWFNNSAEHRTPKTYLTTREKIIQLARENSSKYVTATAVRRSIVGDAGSLFRLHQFLITWGFINAGTIGETAPTNLDLTKEGQKRLMDNSGDALPYKWTADKKKVLALAVVTYSSKKRRRDEDNEMTTNVDWDAVAEQVGEGVKAHECQQCFLSLDLTQFNAQSTKAAIIKSEPDETTSSHQDLSANVKPEYSLDVMRSDVISELIEGVEPEVAEATINTALRATNDNVQESQKAALLGMLSSKAMVEARNEEDATSQVLQEILNNRMTKLEARLNLLDDVEGILDTERMALELERRDLYTARCRQWFGGGA